MLLHYRTILMSLICLCLASLVQAQPPLVPKKEQLSVPIIPAAAAGQPARSLECVAPYGPPAAVAAVAFSPDGKLLAAGAYQEVLVWDLANAKLLKRLGAGQLGDTVHALAFHKGGRLLAVAEGTPHGPASVKLFEIESGKVAASFQEPKDAILAMAFSPDGTLLVGGGVDTTLYAWNVEQKKNVAALHGHNDWILSVCFSADGKSLVSGGADKSAIVWEVPSGKRSATLQETDTVSSASLSADGQLVGMALAGDENRLLRIRRRSDSQPVRDVDLGLAEPLDMVQAAAGNRVYVACCDKTIKVFDSGNWNQLATLAGHSNWVYRVAVSPDGTRLASASADGTVKLWLPAESRLLATLVQLTPRTDEWLILTAPGYFATSAPGALQWKAVGLATPADKLTALFQNAELARQAIAGGKVATPAVP